MRAEGRRALCLLAFLSLLCGNARGFGGSERTGKGCWFQKAFAAESRTRQQYAKRRQLQQTNCALQFGNEELTFSSCETLTSDLGTDFTVHWTVIDDGNGNSTMRAAIDAARTAGTVDWAAFGFNPELEMTGGNAIVVQACSTCSSGASIDDYYLADTRASAVQAPSRLLVTNKTAALSNGRLLGIFEVSLNASGSGLANVGALYAAGPLSSSGALQQHDYQLAQTINLSPGLASSLGPAVAPASAEASSPGPAQAPATSVSPASAASASSPPAVAPSPGPGQSCSLRFAGNGSDLSFAQCQSLATSSTANSGFRLLWTLTPSPTGNGSVMSGAISASASGWAGLGFAAQPGEMLGASAIIVRSCSSCPTGASADRYLLSSYQSSGVNPDTGNLRVTDLSAARSSDGILQAVFNARLGESGINEASPTNIIAAVGPTGSDGGLQSHPVSNAYSGTVNLASGTFSGTQSGGGGDRKPRVHAIMMIVSWGLLIPLGAVFPRCKEWGPIWFQLHRAIQMLGYLAGVAGAAVGAAMGRKNRTRLEDNHRIVGLVVFIVLTLQASAVFWRPAPQPGKLRYSWNALHWFLGGAAIFMAFSNVFIGLHIAGQPARWSGLYALGFGLILILWVLKLTLDLTVLRQSKAHTKAALKQQQYGVGQKQGNRAGLSSAETSTESLQKAQV